MKYLIFQYIDLFFTSTDKITIEKLRKIHKFNIFFKFFAQKFLVKFIFPCQGSTNSVT